MNDEEMPRPVRLSSAHSRDLGEELRRARRRAKMPSSIAASGMEWSIGKLSKLETGSRGTDVLDIAALLGQYRTDKATREHILTIAAERDTGSFVRRHNRSPDTLAALRVHERIARTVTAYEPLTVPALAQTEDYALALTGDRAVAWTRMDRQQEQQSARRELVVYLHEAALRVRVGTPQIMRDQLLHLTLMGGWAGTRVRIVPLTSGFDAMLRNPATLLTFDAPARPVAYAEIDSVTVFHDDSDVVAAYQRKMDHLDRVALALGESRKVLARWVNAYEREAA
ncbi:hypothetical protein F4560_001280 [Saccharothrix ecbatanensis]|uniref:DUF5753 domain-containing protein n=1 Tax=Saccharothrix ecbatanensis TaxID=1105145 RepID=A0A7W9HFW6_9PSEU|nr:DUF5753 domain-containing protein [Saccharothrix ecbatanensis]MBB5801512.1 hypothetical protein [Saccharothrix ecbatanensis]